MQAIAEQAYALAEQEYNFATATFNDGNLQFTKQQSKVASLKQEFEFKNNQLKDLQIQIQSSTTQLNESAANIAETAHCINCYRSFIGLSMLQNKEVEEKKLNEADQAYYKYA